MASVRAYLCRRASNLIRFYYSYPSSPCLSFSTFSGNAAATAASDDRHLLIQKSKEKLQELLNSPTRYQFIEEREDRSDVPQKLIHCETVGRFLGTYRGSGILKTTYDMVVYYQLFSDLKPKTILEMGTFTGASALWFADSIKSLGLDTQIYTVDYDPTLVSESMKKKIPDNVKLIEGDCNKIAEVFPPEMLKSLPHPWLVIEDGNIFFSSVVAHLNDFMEVGDYLVIEDTEPRIPTQVRIYSMDDVEIQQPWGTHKLELLKKFVKSTGKQYMVDSFYTDYYGYNSNWHWHGFLRKCNTIDR